MNYDEFYDDMNYYDEIYDDRNYYDEYLC